jgi:hypothetical protein
MEQPVSSGENSPIKQKLRQPQVALFRCSPNPELNWLLDGFDLSHIVEVSGQSYRLRTS